VTEMRQPTGVTAVTVEIAPHLHFVGGTFRPGVTGRTFETTSPITYLAGDVALSSCWSHSATARSFPT
jgi:hypothetical protein